MDKRTLAREVALRTGLSVDDSEAFIETTFKAIKDTMTSGESITIRRFGTFQVKHMRSKPARNISKGTSLTIPERYVAAFRPGLRFKKAMREIPVK